MMDTVVAQTANAIYPDDIGGLGVHCYELALEQAKNGNHVNVITPLRNVSAPTHEKVLDSFDLFRLSSPWLPWFPLGMHNPYLPSLPHLIRKLNPNFVHAHSHLFLMNLQAVLTARRLKIPSLVTVHGVFAQRNLLTNLAQFGYIATISSWMLAHCSRVICLTNADVILLRRFGIGSDKIRIIPPGINTDLFKPGKEKEGNVLWVGRFVPEKGLGLLMQAARIVCRRLGNSVRFVLVGEGPLKNHIAALIKQYGLEEYVELVPTRNQVQIAKIMGDCSVLVLPSVREGLGKVVLEAMSCGKPVIAFDLPGLRNVIGDSAGILVPRFDMPGFAQAVITLLQNQELRRKLGRTGREYAITKYSWPVVGASISKLYAETLETGSS